MYHSRAYLFVGRRDYVYPTCIVGQTWLNRNILIIVYILRKKYFNDGIGTPPVVTV